MLGKRLKTPPVRFDNKASRLTGTPEVANFYENLKVQA
jgi:hypothetical protein